MPNPFSPTTVEGESPSLVWFEKSLFDGQHLESVAYGVHLSIFAITMYYHLLPPSGKRSWFFIVYLVLLFAGGTMQAAAGIRFAELAWIDDRDIPGGPAAFNVQMYNISVELAGNCGYIISNFLADGLLLWRFFVLYGKNFLPAIIPGLAFLASTTMGILTVFQAARPNASIWSKSAVSVAIPYFCLSLALNALLSVLIAGKLLWHRRTISRTLGRRHTEVYTTVASMFIESAALYAVVGLIFVICFGQGSNVQNLLLGILGQVECIAPELILLKVARGVSWTAATFTKPGGPNTHMGLGNRRIGDDTRTYGASQPELPLRKLASGSNSGKSFLVNGDDFDAESKPSIQ
ncbi:hypothetical protein M422DRAFT_240777 [Sphaerobolus stellatus SS14]|nr:hypothetical protein M422DRAFT_240777 [Sphaerobolus stellatus SS14]